MGEPAKAPRNPDDLPDLTDEHRRLIVEYFAANPDGGYKAACKHAGLSLSRAQARNLIRGDDDLNEAWQTAMGIDETSAWRTIGEINNDRDHKDRLKAAQFIVERIHGATESRRVEVTGLIEDRSASLADVAKILQATGALNPADGG